jgi:hypothetical protein
MTETISVYYTPAFGIPNVYHKYLVYTDSQGNRYATRAGQGIPITGIDFGYITTQTQVYDSSFADFDIEGDDPFETIATGENLSNDWNRIVDAMNQIANDDYLYNPFYQNSNTALDSELR